MSSYDDVGIRVLRQQRVVGKIAHHCDCCSAMIKAGERHDYIVYLDAHPDEPHRHFRTIRMHVVCPEGGK